MEPRRFLQGTPLVDDPGAFAPVGAAIDRSIKSLIVVYLPSLLDILATAVVGGLVPAVVLPICGVLAALLRRCRNTRDQRATRSATPSPSQS